jgi:hypothetical protein
VSSVLFSVSIDGAPTGARLCLLNTVLAYNLG